MFSKLIVWIKKIRALVGEYYKLYLISKSGYFDETWYTTNYPVVSESNMSPAKHYLYIGGFEGLDPSPKFQSDWYLTNYKDVNNEKMNPLVHYILFGQREGRPIRSLEKMPVNYAQDTPAPYQGGRHLMPFNSRKNKVFCIGYNKTGTTSIGRALEELGYKLGNQSVAEQLMDDLSIRYFERIVEYCESADAFQDLPFSVDFTYQILDYAYPGSKFILTVRSNPDEWFESLIRFYKKIMKTDQIPTAEDMKIFPYGGQGWFWRQEQNIFGINESNVCNEKIYKAHYSNHNKRVMEYFRLRPKDLLVLNLSNPEAMRALCEFLGVEYKGQTMPHLNKTRD